MVAWLMRLKAQQAFAALCVVIVVARMIFPGLLFDSLSLYLVLIGAICAVFPNLASLLRSIKRMKGFGAEIEFAIEDLAERTTAIEAAVTGEDSTVPPDPPAGPDDAGPEARVEIEFEAMAADTASFENRARWPGGGADSLYDVILVDLIKTTNQFNAETMKLAALVPGARPRSPREALEILARQGLIDADTPALYRELMKFRNAIVHGDVKHISLAELQSLAETAKRLQKIFRVSVRINLNEEWEVRYWTRELGVSEEELARAVALVGTSAGSVRRALEARRKGGLS